MNTIDEYTCMTTVLEKFIERENESIALMEQAMHKLGDTAVTPVFRNLLAEKHRHREMLEQALTEMNEQFELDEAII
ncbi:MAG: hypothetical protein H3C35_02600 [Bacteroidetes bacterium]|nr:hypothetical protein [Bacteroidota bacterium]